jgi:hypothetical protein
MNRICRRPFNVLPVLTLVVLTFLFVQSAAASLVVVGNCKTGVQFTTIGAAITAVPTGSTIDICPGVYAEQLNVTKSITFTGIASGTADGVVIISPAAGLATNATSLSSGSPLVAHISIVGPVTVNFNNLIVDSLGNGVAGCAPVLIGILYQNASGTLNHVVTRNQWIGTSESDINLNGCQTGLGIYVQSGNSGTSVVTVENSSVHDYQKNGITGNELGTTINVVNDDVVGQGATNGAAENGVQIGFGAQGKATGNFVIDDVWEPDTNTDPGDAAAGILLYDTTGTPLIQNNTVGNTQYGIVIDTDTGNNGGATVMNNKVFGTRIFDGVDVCSNTNTVQSNTIINSAESGIHLDASCGSTGSFNTISTNTVIDACVGILEDAGTGSNTIGTNPYFATGNSTASACTPVASHRTSSIPVYGGLKRGHNVPVRP